MSVRGNTDTHAHTSNYLKSHCKRYKNHSETGNTNYYERESRRASIAQNYYYYYYCNSLNTLGLRT